MNTRSITAVSIALLLASSYPSAGGVNRQAATPRTTPIPYTGFYTGEVLPTPVSLKKTGRTIVVYADASTCCIVVPEKPSSAEELAAQEIALRIAILLGKESLPIDVVKSGVDTGRFAVVIKLTTRDKARHADGYTVEMKQGGRQEVISCAGDDPAGTSFASKTLQQLLYEKDGKILIDSADIDDHPTFAIRGFKIIGQDWKMIAEMAKWAPNFKWNTANICYTAIGEDNWPDPAKEYRETVAEVCRFMTDRGLDTMPFVNPFYLWKSHLHIADEAAMDRLVKTCSIGPEQGCRKVMLCLDDFVSKDRPHKLIHDDDIAKFGTLEKAHIYLITAWRDAMKKAYPDCELFVVTAYYWTPARYKSISNIKVEGNKFLREVCPAIPKDVTIVWTGSVPRSQTITEDDFKEYADLIGRRPFLWDNTIYSYHSPKTYFFDEFITKYPPNFPELNEKGIHINALAGGEIDKVGLATVADKLWNPQSFDPSQSLKKAIAMIAGKECVDDILALRTEFFKIHDAHKGDINALNACLAKVASSCRNKKLVEDIKRRIDDLKKSGAKKR